MQVVEHAISKKLLASPKVDTVYCAPGNPGMTKDGINCVAISERDHSALIHFVKKEAIDWSIVGPEVPLLNGIVDDFMAEGLKIFGPTKAAALIEGSKSFAKQLMDTYQIPTAKSRSFECYEKQQRISKKMGANRSESRWLSSWKRCSRGYNSEGSAGCGRTNVEPASIWEQQQKNRRRRVFGRRRILPFGVCP